jgi:D-lactate dehydrogenase
VALLHKAGYRVILPLGLERQCCGRPFASKGLLQQAEQMAEQLQRALLVASNRGRIPILCDTVPCVQTLLEGIDARLDLHDPVRFIHRFLLPRLELIKRRETVALHVTCSTRKLGLGEMLKDLAERCAERVVVPVGHECCGWAGDRGFTFPELNASALAGLREQIPEDCAAGYCNSRTCEIGASLHSGIHYRSIVYLVDRCSRPVGG